MLNHKQNLFLILSACLASLQKFLKTEEVWRYFRCLLCWDVRTIFTNNKMLLTSVCFFHIVKLYTVKIDYPRSLITQPKKIETRDKLAIWVRCTSNFRTNVRRSNLSCFTDCTKDVSAAALIHQQQTLYWLFTKTKLSRIYGNKPIVTYTCIDPWWKREALRTIWAKLELAITFFILFCREILESVWQE